ncbi:uncharacterized protein FOMMEDRAFT_167911 [Fomitiporia mediterranea MF3/22]|uniref:uncharacterized protein n=1 Tax=Fomitiporia mediterranea (strain MF3/22) TaxID=694068 RepID=UPI0004407D6C|nr:uncharacterized protein FOMMEDRAFT_167911 [Fomitiporia mediterranea MF3/22]EJD02739.1 hypothetical protein FOMMEDRAFT_167911 [Fomitiporia mediterranea MF3/22]
METRLEIPSRLRLNKSAHSFAATVADNSNYYDNITMHDGGGGSEDGDDDGSTPRVGMSSVDSNELDERLHFSAQAQAQSTPGPGRERDAIPNASMATPAERLRAVLSRASSATPTARPLNVASERTPMPNHPSSLLGASDMESEDFDTPRNAANNNRNNVLSTPFPTSGSVSSVPQSAARESLRSLFSYATRSPGNTPERPQRPRRGSMDSSIAEESPIKWSMLRANERVKRLSLSDDEKERIRVSKSGFTEGLSERSFKSSQAATYDQLRERLENSAGGAGTSKGASHMKSDMTIDMEEATEVEQSLLENRQAPIMSTTPPLPSSNTLGQSMSQFPSQFLGSNLLIDNSDMRRMIQDAQSETTDSEAPESNRRESKTPIAGPSSNHQKRPSFVRERALSHSSSIGSMSPSSTGSRPTSRQSMNDLDEGQKRERERGWNHPLGPYMERHRASSPGFSPIHSGGFARLRKTSLSSISGSESHDGRTSPASTVKRLGNGHGHSSSKYSTISLSRLPSSSPNHIRVSARTRTVSQPTKPSSPGNLTGSVSSNGIQKSWDRSRTVSLIARDISRPSSSHAHTPAHASSSQHHNGNHDAEHLRRSASPSSSRSSSRASSHQSEGTVNRVNPHVRERNWNSPRPKWINVEPAPALSTKTRQPDGAMHTRTPPAEHAQRRVTAAHATGSSPSSIPRLSVNGHTKSAKHAEDSETDNRLSKDPVSSSPATRLEHGRHNSFGKDRDTGGALSASTIHNHTSTGGRRPHSPAISSKANEQVRSRHERDAALPHAISPTLSPEPDGANEPEEHDTPKIGLQRIPDSPTPASGSRPSSRVGTTSGFSSHIAIDAYDRVNASATSASASVAEKARRGRDGEQSRNIRPQKVSVPSDPLELHESDLDSFQEEDIVASSSAPRVHNGNDSFDENEASPHSEELQADINVLGPRHGGRPNGHAVDAGAKRSSLLPANFSPPLSPPESPSDPVTTTPERRISGNSSKIEFKSPSTPRDIPALPDPPSSDEDAESDRTPPVPLNRSRFADIKTPRPPGAWSTPFATPAPAIAARVSTLRDEMHHEGEKHASLQNPNEIYTPPASYSRATSMIMKTPKPPGAWMPTPETIAAKRLQQKVRFDEQEVSSAAPALVPERDDSSLISDPPATDGSVAMKAAGRANPPSPRSPGRIRVVDAFGNEINPAKSEVRTENRSSVQKFGELHATGKDEKPGTPDRRKSRIRVLDAMGREIDESQVQDATPLASTADEPGKHLKKADKGDNVTTLFHALDGKLERKEALQLLQKTIAELKDDFNRTDDPASTQTTDEIDSQMADLKVQSIRAKEDRERLLGRIRDAQTGDPPSRSAALWNALLFGKSRSGLSSRGTSFKVFAALVFLQAVIFLAFYRLTTLGARRLFLTTYIDPFYPELHLHFTNPDLVQLSMTAPDMYAAIASPPVPTTGWIRFFLAGWHTILNSLLVLRDSMWDIWRDPPQGITWPPT